MTVAEMIAKLRALPQDLEVEMAMNQEYQEAVTADMIIEYQDIFGRRYVLIDDTAPYHS